MSEPARSVGEELSSMVPGDGRAANDYRQQQSVAAGQSAAREQQLRAWWESHLADDQAKDAAANESIRGLAARFNEVTASFGQLQQQVAVEHSKDAKNAQHWRGMRKHLNAEFITRSIVGMAVGVVVAWYLWRRGG